MPVTTTRRLLKTPHSYGRERGHPLPSPARACQSGDPQAIVQFLDEDVLWIAPPGNATQVAARLPNGRDYVNDYCFAYEVRNEKVYAIREYMDTRGGWTQVFGGAEPRQLLEFVRP